MFEKMRQDREAGERMTPEEKRASDERAKKFGKLPGETQEVLEAGRVLKVEGPFTEWIEGGTREFYGINIADQFDKTLPPKKYKLTNTRLEKNAGMGG